MAEDLSQEEYDDSPEGVAKRIQVELAASKRWMERWHGDAKHILEAFKDSGRMSRTSDGGQRYGETKMNLFWSDTTVKKCILYGKPPKTDVSRRFGDAKDQQGRVAGEIIERILNSDTEGAEATFAFALECTVDDYLKPGLGCIKFRYHADFETIPGQEAIEGEHPADAVPEQQRKKSECIYSDYVPWRNVRFAAGTEVWPPRWIAFMCEMSRKQIIERFSKSLARMLYDDPDGDEDSLLSDEEAQQAGEDLAKMIPLDSPRGDRYKEDQARRYDPWSRADVWEFWDRENKCVYWYVEGVGHILDHVDDPLQLKDFFPCARFLIDNWGTDEMLPRPTYMLCRDLYDNINKLSTRIERLVDTLKVHGVYDKTSTALQRLVQEARDNEMIPVENWQMFSDKGGVEKAFAMFPLRDIAQTILDLRAQRDSEIDSLRQVSGMGDILRGQTQENGTPGEAQLEAKFGSVRMQYYQNEIARFATDCQQIRMEIIARLFEPKTILEQSNARFTFDSEQPEVLQGAVELIKSRHTDYRIVVKPESVALDDFGSARGEAVELLGAVGTFFKEAAPLVQAAPQAAPLLFELFQWMMSRVKGAKEMEGVVDQMAQRVAQAGMAAQQQQQQNPGAQQQQARMAEITAKSQADAQKIQLETQADIARTHAETQAQLGLEQQKHQMDIQEAEQREAIKARYASQPQIHLTHFPNKPRRLP